MPERFTLLVKTEKDGSTVYTTYRGVYGAILVNQDYFSFLQLDTGLQLIPRAEFREATRAHA